MNDILRLRHLACHYLTLYARSRRLKTPLAHDDIRAAATRLLEHLHSFEVYTMHLEGHDDPQRILDTFTERQLVAGLLQRFKRVYRINPKTTELDRKALLAGIAWHIDQIEKHHNGNDDTSAPALINS